MAEKLTSMRMLEYIKLKKQTYNLIVQKKQDEYNKKKIELLLYKEKLESTVKDIEHLFKKISNDDKFLEIRKWQYGENSSLIRMPYEKHQSFLELYNKLKQIVVDFEKSLVITNSKVNLKIQLKPFIDTLSNQNSNQQINVNELFNTIEKFKESIKNIVKVYEETSLITTRDDLGCEPLSENSISFGNSRQANLSDDRFPTSTPNSTVGEKVLRAAESYI